jgi:hypothetical protein
VRQLEAIIRISESLAKMALQVGPSDTSHMDTLSFLMLLH